MTWLDDVCLNPENMVQVTYHPVKTFGEDDQGGIWQRLKNVQYGDNIPIYIERMFEYSCGVKRKDGSPIIPSLFLFFCILTREIDVQNEIVRQLKEEEKEGEDIVSFFKDQYLEYAQRVVDDFLQQPFTTDNIQSYMHMFLLKLKTVWFTRDEQEIQTYMNKYLYREDQKAQLDSQTDAAKKLMKRVTQQERQKMKRLSNTVFQKGYMTGQQKALLKDL